MGILNKLLGIPPVGSEHGHLLDHMLEIVHWFMLFLGLGWGIFIAYALFRFRRKNHPKASYSGVTGNAARRRSISTCRPASGLSILPPTARRRRR
jgi:cytochrome c oxidase subunit 2